MATRVIWASVLAAAVLLPGLLSGCSGGGDDGPGTGPTTTSTGTPTTGEPTTTPPDDGEGSDEGVLGEEVLEGNGASVRLPVGWAYKEEVSVPGMFVQAGPLEPGDGLRGTVAVIDQIPFSGSLAAAARSQIESSVNTTYRRVDDVTIGEHTFYRVVAGRGEERSEIHGTVVAGIEYAVQFNLHGAGGAARAEADALIEAVMGSWTLT